MNKSIVKKATILLCILFLCTPVFLGAQETSISVQPGDMYGDYCQVYFYPHVLNQKDQLQDGPNKRLIPIEGNTLLVWVNLEPEMDFLHPTLYILISKQEIRTLKGEWWPVVNGKQVLYGEEEKYAILSPFSMDTNSYENIDVYIYPHELYPSDRLVDGLSGDMIKIVDNTLLIWVDLLPRAKFTHPTAYILISKEYTYMVKGGWWPELNGKRICYGEQNKLGVISPFLLLSQHIDTD
jgi:hypothetical protein